MATINEYETEQIENANTNEGVTAIVELPDRGRALTIDSGWRQVDETGPPSSNGLSDRPLDGSGLGNRGCRR